MKDWRWLPDKRFRVFPVLGTSLFLPVYGLQKFQTNAI